MTVLPKIFGYHPQIVILEVFIDHFEEELSVPDLVWMTDISRSTVYNYLNRLLDEKIICKGSIVSRKQFYRLNTEKQEVKMVLSLVNNIVTGKLAEKLEERGLKPIDS